MSSVAPEEPQVASLKEKRPAPEWPMGEASPPPEDPEFFAVSEACAEEDEEEGSCHSEEEEYDQEEEDEDDFAWAWTIGVLVTTAEEEADDPASSSETAAFGLVPAALTGLRESLAGQLPVLRLLWCWCLPWMPRLEFATTAPAKAR